MQRTNNTSWYLYYTGRDYLGSITHVFNERGSVMQEQSYDAWGNLRNPATHELYPVDAQPALYLGRGYTGHEHLSFCGLINMNARLYDPAAGRFLSPDPYVQDPTNPQHYNRYSYALNNPLKYIDPTGEVKKEYTYDRDRNCFVDEEGNGVDYSVAYKAMFSSGLFRDRNYWYDGTSYGGNPSVVSGGGGFSVIYKKTFVNYATYDRVNGITMVGTAVFVPVWTYDASHTQNYGELIYGYNS
jgi:RHS repeat-associated protein